MNTRSRPATTTTRRYTYSRTSRQTLPLGSAELPVTEDICSRIVSLPVHDDMAPDNVARVVAAVQEGSSQ